MAKYRHQHKLSAPLHSLVETICERIMSKRMKLRHDASDMPQGAVLDAFSVLLGLQDPPADPVDHAEFLTVKEEIERIRRERLAPSEAADSPPPPASAPVDPEGPGEAHYTGENVVGHAGPVPPDPPPRSCLKGAA